MVTKSLAIGMVINMRKNLIVIPPKSIIDSTERTPESCKILLIPDTAPQLLGFYDADCVVSYGLSEKSTISPSSISEYETVVSLQRELPTLDGEIIEQQEILLRRPDGISVESFLAIAGLFLINGVPPEKLSEFF